MDEFFTLVGQIIDVKEASLNEAILDQLSFCYAHFLRDFGPWRKGEIVDCIDFDFDRGRVVEYNNEGEKVKGVQLQLVAGETLVLSNE